MDMCYNWWADTDRLLSPEPMIQVRVHCATVLWVTCSLKGVVSTGILSALLFIPPWLSYGSSTCFWGHLLGTTWLFWWRLVQTWMCKGVKHVTGKPLTSGGWELVDRNLKQLKRRQSGSKVLTEHLVIEAQSRKRLLRTWLLGRRSGLLVRWVHG